MGEKTAGTTRSTRTAKTGQELGDWQFPGMSWPFAALFVALFNRARVMCLAQAAFLDECLFERLNLTIQQQAGNADQADNDVGADGRVGMLDPLAKRCIGGARNPVQRTQADRVTVVKRPFLDSASPQEIAIIG